MNSSDKIFCGFLRMLITQVKRALAEKDPQKKDDILREILTDLQNTLED